MTCGSCRAKHRDNEQEDMVPCDQTGEPCDLRKIELMPENELAWSIYTAANLEGVGELALEIELQTNPELVQLTPSAARDLLHKFHLIASISAEMMRDRLKQQQEEAKHGSGAAATR